MGQRVGLATQTNEQIVERSLPTHHRLALTHGELALLAVDEEVDLLSNRRSQDLAQPSMCVCVWHVGLRVERKVSSNDRSHDS